MSNLQWNQSHLGAVIEYLQAAQLVIGIELTLDANIFQEIVCSFDTHMAQYHLKYCTNASNESYNF